ncbi:hypothetical protein ACW0KB_11975 [Virgibacillus salarius]
MKVIHFLVDDNNYVSGGISYGKMEDAIKLEVTDDHPILTDNANVYKYENGELVADEEYRQKIIDEKQEKENEPSDEELNAIALMELAQKVYGGGK